MDFSFIRDPLVFVDLETTGANFANDRILEIGIVEVDQDGVREWSSLVNPETGIPPFITQLTGIDAAMVKSAPVFSDLAQEVLEKLSGKLFVAHNARFDYSFLKREFLRLGISFRANALCTVKLSRKLFPEHHRHSLETLVARFGISVDARHRALADARVLWDLWQRWHALKDEAMIQNAVEAIVGRPQLPPQLDPSIIDDLPESHGAYALLGKEGERLKIKRASNIRQQALSHFQPASRDTRLVRDTWRIAWRESAGEFGARIGEFDLSAATHARLDELCSWQLRRQEEHVYLPELVLAEEFDFASTPNLFGLYASRREALTALRKVVEANNLCHAYCGIGTTGIGEPCVGFKQRTCRGTCVGKEDVSLHSARLMSALARYKIVEWPFDGPVALIERDEFGMREDFHVIDRWRHLGVVQREHELNELLENPPVRRFDPDLYRLISKAIAAGKLRIVPLGPSRSK
ncbi:3'-5' exonuclease family protein [Propionivibrio dicarboxylicus]|uniref:DNA-directed DNA polymerase n=1 Tax=Propionivibrio dicarboxylicus TaxID=83767 RepID=A0A1G8D201_9RHOO|nr:3'-5' exonuclease family protein [Propionivibrio dicarboxylicus]SDH51554.1 DNA polymerase-3 subunit epsilon [Propionivibrio dicarboxylicus]